MGQVTQYRFRKIPAASYQHAAGDPRPATRYEVLAWEVGSFPTVIGEVASRSAVSEGRHGRLRYTRSRSGRPTYERHWIAQHGPHTITRHAYSRQEAAEALWAWRQVQQ